MAKWRDAMLPTMASAIAAESMRLTTKESTTTDNKAWLAKRRTNMLKGKDDWRDLQVCQTPYVGLNTNVIV